MPKVLLNIFLSNQNAPPVGFMDSGPKTATGYDMEQEYDYIMQKAMNSYLTHRRSEENTAAEEEPAAEKPPPPSRPYSSLSSVSSLYTHKLPNRSAVTPRLRSARSARAVRPTRTMSVPSTISLDLEKLNPLKVDNARINALRPKKRPLTAHYIHYPITGKMSKFPTVKSYSEHTTPTKMSKDGKQYHYEGGLFKPHGKAKRDFIINPEWVSENLTIEKLKINERTRNYPIIDMRYATYPIRRCRSAPPPRHRNPITWE
ncbi:uncharacterized protein LOC141906100 isoform X2 [Tubulanus polymorphus]|uniref:uncharacterized protein LOC141906100 isoform X2 n=1 Tax=Tubulanus polymorphus TaxID=672921 RepID=UPI003DA1F2FF